MLTAEKVTDQCTDGERPTVDQIISHFEDTIFWNWSGDFSKELFNEQRRSEELPLSVGPDIDKGDGFTDRELHFESGECCIHVATFRQCPSDETAHAGDAHFVANLPVYLPELFKAIEELRKENAELRGEVADANLKLVKIREAMKG